MISHTHILLHPNKIPSQQFLWLITVVQTLLRPCVQFISWLHLQLSVRQDTTMVSPAVSSSQGHNMLHRNRILSLVVKTCSAAIMAPSPAISQAGHHNGISSCQGHNILHRNWILSLVVKTCSAGIMAPSPVISQAGHTMVYPAVRDTTYFTGTGY